MEVLNRRAPFFYNELNRNVKSENTAENTRIPSVVNTYQNIPFSFSLSITILILAT